MAASATSKRTICRRQRSRPASLACPDPIQSAVNDSYISGSPMLVASVPVEGQPLLSLRGSFQAYSPASPAFWARNVGGASSRAKQLAHRLPARPKNRTNLMFYGRGRVCGTEDERMKVYNRSPEPERLAGPQIRGQGVIMDLDKASSTPDVCTGRKASLPAHVNFGSSVLPQIRAGSDQRHSSR